MLRLIGLTAALLTLAVPAIAQEDFQFRTPTGNILCKGYADNSGASASCYIMKMASKIPPRPSDCDSDWGHEFGIRTQDDEGERYCYSDFGYDTEAQVLDYGQEMKVGDITCRSERSGVTCTNGKGHGFEVARLRQDLF